MRGERRSVEARPGELLSVDRIGQEYAPRIARTSLIARGNVDHAAGDSRARPVQPAAGDFTPAQGLMRNGGVIVPDHLAIGGVIGTKMTVHGTGENDSVHRSNGLR